MNAEQMTAKLERLEMDPSKPADFRRLVRDERMTIMARLQKQDFVGAQNAVAEAQRVLDMWAAYL